MVASWYGSELVLELVYLGSDVGKQLFDVALSLPGWCWDHEFAFRKNEQLTWLAVIPALNLHLLQCFSSCFCASRGQNFVLWLSRRTVDTLPGTLGFPL